MGKQAFHLQQAIAFAWNFLWQDNLAMRAKNNDFRGNTYYLTASDVEDQVRQLAYESHQGKPWGSTGRAWGGAAGKLRISVPGSTLQHEVRDYLLSNRNITGHNFGRGHISGMRFRPVGEPIGPAEKTLAKKAEQRANPKPRPIHYAPGSSTKPLCSKRSAFARWNPRGPRVRSDWEQVTCKRCQNLKEQAA